MQPSVPPAGGRVIRRWMMLFVAGNLLAFAAAWHWFPSAGLDLARWPHVRLAALTIVLTVLALAPLAASLFTRRAYETTLWLSALLQAVRLLPATQATDSWPGGDDGQGLGWGFVVRPIVWLLGLAAVGVSGWFSYRRLGRHSVDLTAV